MVASGVIQLATRVVCQHSLTMDRLLFSCQLVSCQHPLTNDFLQCEGLPFPSFGSYFILVYMLQFVTICGMVIWNEFLIRKNRLWKDEIAYSS